MPEHDRDAVIAEPVVVFKTIGERVPVVAEMRRELQGLAQRAQQLGLATDAVLSPMDPGERERLEATLNSYLPAALRRTKPAAADFKKVVAGRKLWNFDKREWRIWQEAL